MTADARWLVQRVENGRFALLDPAAAAEEPAIARLSVSPTRDRGEVTHASGEVWRVVRDVRDFRFHAASGRLLAVATKPSVIRERFGLDLAALGGQLTVQPVRPWWRCWRIVDEHRMIGTVERRRRSLRAHELRLPRAGSATDELAAVVSWLVALVCTDPPRGWRSLSDTNGRR